MLPEVVKVEGINYLHMVSYIARVC